MPDTADARAPIVVVLNAGSGRDLAQARRDTIEGVLREARREHQVLLAHKGRELPALAQQAVDMAKQGDGRGVVVAAGGDGTINAVVQAVLGSGLAFGALPQGTFNYFGRRHGLPLDTAEATRALLSARPQPVQVGLVNGHAFVVNASLGLYPQVLQDREAYKRRYGRHRLVALWSALATLAQAPRPLKLRLESHGNPRDVRTATLFVGNNRLQLEQIGIPESQALDQGELAAITLRPVGMLKMLHLMMRGAFGALGGADDVVSFSFDRLTVRPAAPFGKRPMKVAVDGEMLWLKAPIEFRVSPQPLMLLKPQAPAAADDT